jgi:cytosine deaminase
VLIQDALLPRGLRGPSLQAFADSQAFDLRVEAGRVAEVVPSESDARRTVISATVDLHVHLDKNYVISETGASPGNLFQAIGRMAAHRDGWSEDHIRPRFERGLSDAYRHGTRALRTHIDYVAAAPPPGWRVASHMRSAWAGRIELQMVSLTPLDVFDDLGTATAIAASVAATPGALLGAFVYRNENMTAKLERVFALARQLDLSIDFHVDEGLDLDATGLAEIARLTVAHGWHDRVTCGHCCSLSVQSSELARRTLELCVEAGIQLVSLPTTNAYLQGSWQGTPVERGVTRVIEADALGVATSIATDNVEDAFYPYGSYDLVANFGFGVMLAHLASPHAWLPAITTRPAAAMRLAWDGRIEVGAPADLLVLDASTEHELLTPRGQKRRAMRSGQWLSS